MGEQTPLPAKLIIAEIIRLRQEVERAKLIVGPVDGQALLFNGPVVGAPIRILPYHLLQELRAALNGGEAKG